MANAYKGVMAAFMTHLHEHAHPIKGTINLHSSNGTKQFLLIFVLFKIFVPTKLKSQQAKTAQRKRIPI